MPMQAKDSCRKWLRLDRPGRLERARVCPLGTRSARARCSRCERKRREFQQLNLARPDLQLPQFPRLQRPGWLAIPADSHSVLAPCADPMGGSGSAALGRALRQEPKAE